ncbi:DJ-1/PfpI family protein [Deinococcus arcticus]|uniref:Transcriptional regulator n=1 Tax=Deinococcus arcticus TaxID=2136176 RepID=A0A2T3WCX6_9DEIO|nr:DJ-1/PfpI family protein [Deinococcus arcticus]PTA69727.1 transcriptional regulator [Deinococcus arcticus]
MSSLTPDPDAQTGPVVALPVYHGVSELELGVMVTVLRLCGGDRVAVTVNRSRISVITAGGLVTTPHVLYAALPEPGALLLPGGPGAARAARDPLLRAFLAAHPGLPTGASGSGLLLLGEAGTLDGRVVGGPADLADTLWGFTPADVRPGEVVTDGPLCSAPAGLGALHAALHVAGTLWGQEAAQEAAQRIGAGAMLALQAT